MSIAFLVGPSGPWRVRAHTALAHQGFDPRVFASEGQALGSLSIHRPDLVLVSADLSRRDVLLFAGAVAQTAPDVRLVVVARVGWDGVVPAGLRSRGVAVLSETEGPAAYAAAVAASPRLEPVATADPKVSMFDASGRQEAELVELESTHARLRTRSEPLRQGTPVRFRLRNQEGLPEIRCLGEVTRTVADGDESVSDISLSAILPEGAADLLREKLKGPSDSAVVWIG